MPANQLEGLTQRVVQLEKDTSQHNRLLDQIQDTQKTLLSILATILDGNGSTTRPKEAKQAKVAPEPVKQAKGSTRHNEQLKEAQQHAHFNNGFDIKKELAKRNLKCTPDELGRIVRLLGDWYTTPEQTAKTFDNIAYMASKEAINNLPGYIYATFRKEHTFLHKDYVNADI